jgi:ACT domain-containing protein
MDSLDDKQLKFINAYFKYNSINEVCKDLKITRPTYYKYLNDTNVNDAIVKQRLEIMQGATRHLQTNLGLCSDELIKIIKSDKTPPQVKINAINSVFTNCNKLTEQIDIITELDNIEQKLQNTNH